MRERRPSARGSRAGGGLAVAPQPRLRDRALARLESHKLDEALASGTFPEASPALALRARQLTAMSHRRSMAAAIDTLVREGRGSPETARLRIRPLHARVLAAREELSRLAAELALPGPVAAQGAAQAELLLTDGTGALYNPANGASVGSLAAKATANLALTLRR
jgi:hypothetical protein